MGAPEGAAIVPSSKPDAVPDMLALADGIRNRFGGSLKFFEVGGIAFGNPAHMTPGVTVQGDWNHRPGRST